MFRIHKEGTATLLLVFLLIVVLNILIAILVVPPVWLVTAILLISVFFFLFIVSFFRNPLRVTNAREGEVVSPADGKVVVIEETEETEYLHSRRIQVSIFMSPANVHVNRAPVSGEVKYVKHHPGKYLVAWHPKSSTENERTTTVFGINKSEILVRQIAGKVARRIVNYLQTGKQVRQGEEMGFIKFGSRVDVFLPVGSSIPLKLNQKVTGGVTIIAVVNQS